jgi:hypothetical protein
MGPTPGSEPRSHRTRLLLLAGAVVVGVVILLATGQLDHLFDGSARSGSSHGLPPTTAQGNSASAGAAETIAKRPGAEGKGTANGKAQPATSSEKCGQQLYGTRHTGCPFARAIVVAFRHRYITQHAQRTSITAYSPAGRRLYHLKCIVLGEHKYVECSTGTATVNFPLSASP